jgi:2-C-methyl-D-erythritol 4-phosphate cytidylyltransferase
MVSAVFAKGQQTGAALLAVPVTDTVKQADDKHKVQQTVTRKGLWLAQTPQVFRRDWLIDAYAKRGQLGKDITDDAQLMEAAGHPVHLVEGAPTNIKITTKVDLILAEAILKAMPKPKPSGPAHPFAEEEMWEGKGLK